MSALAAAMIAGGIVAGTFSIKEVAKVGSCGNGQVVINDNYSSKPCPEGTGTLIVVAAGGIIAAIAGVFVFALKGSPPGRRARRTGAGPVPATMGAYSGSSPPGPVTPPPVPGAPAGSAGTSAPSTPAYTPPQPKPAEPIGTPPASSPPADAPALPTMPSVPPPPGISTPPPSAAAPAADSSAGGEDPVKQLARLDKLREQGVLSESEFADAKRRLLGDL